MARSYGQSALEALGLITSPTQIVVDPSAVHSVANAGTGAGVLKDVDASTGTLTGRSLKGGGSTTVVAGANEVTISSSGGGSGRVGNITDLGEDPTAISGAQVDAAEIFVAKSTHADAPATHPEALCGTAEPYDLGPASSPTIWVFSLSIGDITASNTDPGFADPEAATATELAAVLTAGAGFISLTFAAETGKIRAIGTGPGGTGETFNIMTAMAPPDLNDLLDFTLGTYTGVDGSPGLTLSVADPTTPASSKGFPVVLVNDNASAGSIGITGSGGGIGVPLSPGQYRMWHWGSTAWCSRT